MGATHAIIVIVANHGIIHTQSIRWVACRPIARRLMIHVSKSTKYRPQHTETYRGTARRRLINEVAVLQRSGSQSVIARSRVIAESACSGVVGACCTLARVTGGAGRKLTTLVAIIDRNVLATEDRVA